MQGSDTLSTVLIQDNDLIIIYAQNDYIAFDVVRETENMGSVLRSTIRIIIHRARGCIAKNGNHSDVFVRCYPVGTHGWLRDLRIV